MIAHLQDNLSGKGAAAASGNRRLRTLVFSALLLACGQSWAQSEPVHYFHSADLPPGTVGQGQLLRGGPLAGYFQPVALQAPPGARIALFSDGSFLPSQPAPALAGMLIGQVYRFKVTQIPNREGYELFPSVELVNRLYPPPGLAVHFPIPIQLTQQELELALDGNFVTRVIYLENPGDALPVRDEPGQQRSFEVRFDEDPLRIADRLGRPMAILRIGSRLPDFDAVSQRFTFGSPPLVPLAQPAPLPARGEGLEDAPAGADADGNFRRLPLPADRSGQQHRGDAFGLLLR